MGVETGDKKDLGPTLGTGASEEPLDGEVDTMRRRRRRGMRVPSDDVPRPKTASQPAVEPSSDGAGGAPVEKAAGDSPAAAATSGETPASEKPEATGGESALAAPQPVATATADDFDVDIDETPLEAEPEVKAAEVQGFDLAAPEDLVTAEDAVAEELPAEDMVEEPAGSLSEATSPPPPMPVAAEERSAGATDPTAAVEAAAEAESAPPPPSSEAAPSTPSSEPVPASAEPMAAAATEVTTGEPTPELELSSSELEEEQVVTALPPPPPRAALRPTPPKAPPAPPRRAPVALPEEKTLKKLRKGKAWFEEIFDEDYLRTLPFLTPKTTQREAAHIIDSIGLKAGQHVLDVGCGYGRHAMEIAARGYNVSALDLSLPLLLRGADEAQRRGLNINFVHGDMREMTFDAAFDGAYCVFSTFGYFDDDTNKRTAALIARALKPGGRLVLDLLNRDYIIADLPTRVWWEGDGCVVLEEVDFNYYTSRLVSTRSIVFDDGRQVEQEISIRSYSLHEVGKLLHGAGFRVLSVSGGLAARGRFFGKDSRQIIVLAERRADATPGKDMTSTSAPTPPAAFSPSPAPNSSAGDPGNGKA